MISNVSTNPSLRFSAFTKQAGTEKSQIDVKTSMSENSYMVNISDAAKAASADTVSNIATPQTQPQSSILELIDRQEASSGFKISENNGDDYEDVLEGARQEYLDAANRLSEESDAAAAGWRKKLAALRIAMRIANGDNVPMQDHRFLAEYDGDLYKASMRAGMLAENDDPADYESLADEMMGQENALSETRNGEDGSSPSADVAEVAQPVESVDTYY